MPRQPHDGPPANGGLSDAERCRLVSSFMVELLSLRRNQNTSVDWNVIAVEWCICLGQIEQRPITASQIAKIIGLPRSTVWRMLDRLSSTGSVERLDGARFRLTDRTLSKYCSPKISREYSRLINRAASLMCR